jgi:hypothetical protein
MITNYPPDTGSYQLRQFDTSSNTTGTIVVYRQFTHGNDTTIDLGWPTSREVRDAVKAIGKKVLARVDHESPAPPGPPRACAGPRSFADSPRRPGYRGYRGRV